MLRTTGVPPEKIVPFALAALSSNKSSITYKTDSARPYYSLDKTRTLGLACMAIRNKKIQFPNWKGIEPFAKDFLALIEDSTTSVVREFYRITRDKKKSDDWAHAVNFLAVTCWHITGQWPSFADMLLGSTISAEEDRPM